MPKISNNEIKIYHKDIKKSFTVTVMYNQKYHFYAPIPKEFSETVNHLSESELKELSISKNYEKKYHNSVTDKYEAVITADTESECLKKMNLCIESLLERILEKRNVIIVFYNPKDTSSYNEHRYNEKHPQIGFQYGLTYAIETSVGDKKVYSTYKDYKAFGETHTERKELSLWNKAATIIPDTPENRKTLEQLYDALKKLNEKIASFTESPDKLLDFISSKQLLLSDK